MASTTPVASRLRKMRSTGDPQPNNRLPEIVPASENEPKMTKKKAEKTTSSSSVLESVRRKRQEAGIDPMDNTTYALPIVPDEAPEEILKRLREGQKNFLDDLIGDALDFSDDEEMNNSLQGVKKGITDKGSTGEPRKKPSVEELRWKNIRHADYFRMINWVQNGKNDDIDLARDLLFKEDEAIEREEREAEGIGGRDLSKRTVPDLSDAEDD